MASSNDVSLATLNHASLPAAQYTTAAMSSSTATAGWLTGALTVTMNNSGATPGTLTTRTALQMIADSSLQVGQKYLLILANGQGTGVLTLAGGTGVTITGTATVATSSARIFVVSVDTGSTMTFTNVCGGIVAP